MKSYSKYILLAIVMLLFHMALFGQTTLHVVTKKTEYEYVFKKSDALVIRAEKGVVDIRPGATDILKVTTKIIVKNKDLKTARKEVGYVQYTPYQKNNLVQLSNKIILPRNATLKSIVRVEYIIEMPAGANVSIENNFGQVRISDISLVGNLDIEYCDLILHNVSGSVNVSSNIGDLVFSGFNGSLAVDSKYATIQINNPAGKIELNSDYGSIRTDVNQSVSEIVIDAKRCDVTLQNKNCTESSLFLEASYAAITLDEECYVRKKEQLSRKSTGSQPNIIHTYKYSSAVGQPSISVKTSYGNINLN